MAISPDLAHKYSLGTGFVFIFHRGEMSSKSTGSSSIPHFVMSQMVLPLVFDPRCHSPVNNLTTYFKF